MFIKMLFNDPRCFATMVLTVVFSICVHEFLHAWTALKMGDPTAAENGHLTMNPFKQMGWISLLMLAFIGIAWGQVPVNNDNLPTKKSRIVVALAGVFGNLLLSLSFAVLTTVILFTAPYQSFALKMMIYASVINLVLFFINLMPIPGFDGFNVVREFIRFNSQKTLERINIAFFIMAMLLFIGINHLFSFAEKIIIEEISFMYNLAAEFLS